ncbi:MAG: hypothetical protein AB7F23_03080 [Phycisphaerae bacterium]
MLGIVIVNYKTNERLIKYINEELPKVSYPNKIVIVNNSATEESDQEIIAGCGAVLVDDRENIDKNAKIYLLSEQENHGYARGNNIGAKFLLQHFDVKYFCFSNCDLVYKDDDIVDRLIETIAGNTDIGLIGPDVRGANGKHQSPRLIKSVWMRNVIPRLFYPLIPKEAKRKFFTLTARNPVTGDCAYIAGCVFVISREAFIESQMFDENTFLYAEEPILAARIKLAGYRVYFLGEVTVYHDDHAEKSDYGLIQRHKGNRYYLKKYQNLNSFELFMYDFSFAVFYFIWFPIWKCVKRFVFARR